MVDLEARPCPPVPPAPSTPAALVLLVRRLVRRLEARPATAHGRRSQALHPSGALHTCCAVSLASGWGASARSPARLCCRPSISHVIPLRLVQTLNWHRWNCNVFGVSRKMTTINYVRSLGGGGVVAARGRRSLAPPLPVGIAGASRAEFLACSGACCYKRRQSKVFFVWISDPLLQTSSIRRLFL